MSESLETSNTDYSSLTPIETVRFQFTRCLIFVLGIVSVGLSFLGGYYVILCFVFVFLCPMLANVVWWQSRFVLISPQTRFIWQNPSTSGSSQGKGSTPRLAKPQFLLPIIEHFVCAYIRHSAKQSGDVAQSALVRFESSSIMNPSGKFQTWLVNRQNSVLVAFIASCCQVYCIVAYFMYLWPSG